MSYYMTIDLHGLTKEEAKKKLCSVLSSLPGDVGELTVIHGYHSGTALQGMIRSFRHPKVERKILSLNQGETVFVIKK